jgi:carboxypeptidase C (cathepsin A)
LAVDSVCEPSYNNPSDGFESVIEKVSNIMYLDSPAGVGMSYSLNRSDYVTGDLKTAADAHKFLSKVLRSATKTLPYINLSI